MLAKLQENPINYFEQIIDRVPAAANVPGVTNRHHKIPVCYDPVFAPDIMLIAEQKGLTPADVIEIHVSKIYRVYMIGFLPGFAYMGSVDSSIATPRLEKPRQLVMAGSVGIAGNQTGIYPLDSPGGWNIIGRTPIKLFDINSRDPCYFNPGDTVQFMPITRHAFEELIDKA